MGNTSTEMSRQYIAIDLKSFYASVECVERGLDPLSTHLVVADASRTDKTICLAVTPSLKAYGISGRARLFEVVRAVKDINLQRKRENGWRGFSGSSSDSKALSANKSLALEYIIAPPRMAFYIEYSTKIYDIYLRYISPEDIHVYSIDEVFIDASPYLGTYGLTAHELAMKLIREVLAETGITATAGIATNLYLCKVAMDIVAKHIPPDKDGVRIAELDEMGYRRQLWTHRPLTDFWRIGPGIARKLENNQMWTMGDVARASLTNENMLYRLFGVNAQLLIDHAWGWEPVTIADIKAYRPAAHSISNGQVLSCPYDNGKARIVVQEMADGLALELLEKGFVTSKVGLYIGFDVNNLKDPQRRANYHGRISIDHYGREVPYHANGTESLPHPTSSSRIITDALLRIFNRTVDSTLLVRRITVVADKVKYESDVRQKTEPVQLELFTDYDQIARDTENEAQRLSKERRMQEAVLYIKKRFGKNAILKGLNFADGATARTRNQQIGGHHE